MSLKFKKISGSTPYLLNSASTAEELTLALEDYMRTGAQIIFQHDGEDCILTAFEYKTGIESTVIAYFVTPKKKLLKVDIGAGYDLVITEMDIGGVSENFEFITVADIDEICETDYQFATANEVKF